MSMTKEEKPYFDEYALERQLVALRCMGSISSSSYIDCTEKVRGGNPYTSNTLIYGTPEPSENRIKIIEFDEFIKVDSKY